MVRLFSGLLKLAFFLALVFYGAGGWYFSEQLKKDALERDPYTPAFNLSIASVGEDSITLRQGSEEVPDLFNPAIYGLEWTEGYGRLGNITGQSSSDVTREFELLAGDDPEEGSTAAIDVFAYPENPKIAHGLDFDDVPYTSPIGEMSAWHIPGGSNLWVIHVHGKGATPAEALRMIPTVADLGHHQLAITYRNDFDQPIDPSGYYRYGKTEWQDLDGAVSYAMEAGADGVVLVGYSTGGAIALSFLYNSSLNEEVVGVILDAPNIDFSETVSYGASKRTLPFTSIEVPTSLVWVAKQISAFRFDLDWDELNYVAGAEQLEVPVLVFHGDADESVPIETSRALAEARPDLVTLVEVPGAAHVQSWNTDPDEYENQVRAFLSEVD